MGPEVIEGELVETTALAHRNGGAISEWTPRFAITVDQAVEVVEQKRDFMKRVMRENEHFGVIPGTTTKPVLFKPGAELLLSSMGLHPRYRDTAPAIEDWTGTEHGGEPFFRYRKTCMITRQTGPGPEDYVVIAEAGGNCNSWEKKYRWRNAERICPSCGEKAIIRGKAEFGGGWLCWKKKNGCGEKFTEDDIRITKQETGQVANPDVADLANTLEKMADKRALVAATLLATGCSDIFTQDLEDGVDDARDPEPPAKTQAKGGQGRAGAFSYAATGRPNPTEVEQEISGTANGEAEVGAAGPEPTGESGNIEMLRTLAKELPRTPRTGPQIDKLVTDYGYAVTLKRVVNEHKLQCGSKCPHLGAAPEEIPF
jgi:hypothetical protein